MSKDLNTAQGPAIGKNRAVRVRNVTLVGLVINLLLSALKFAAGVIGSSQAMVADAVHSLSDMATDLAIIWGVKYWSDPPDERHPHGHGRIETVVTVLIGASLVVVALGIGYNALATIGGRHVGAPGTIALVAAGIAIITKELLYRWTVSVGKTIKSPAMIANAWHHRSDALSSIPALVAVTVAIVKPAWAFVDRLGAVLVSLFILQAAWKIVQPAVSELTDAAAPEAVKAELLEIAKRTAGVREVHELRTRYIGPGLAVDLHALVDGNITVNEGHAIAEELKARLLRLDEVVDVVVHVEPHPV